MSDRDAPGRTPETSPAPWRSLEDLADSPAFRELVEREFPERASEWSDPAGRRRFLHLMGASFALAGLASCAPPKGEKIVPYVKQPEDLIPGKPLYYATAIRLAGIAAPVLVTSTMGRPIKIEGNPEHPECLGATDAFTQAALLDLFDPDRSRTVTNLGSIRPYSDLLTVIHDACDAQAARRGDGLRILTGAISSPTLLEQLAELRQRFPLARWHQHEAIDESNVREGARRAFGEVVDTRLQLANADVILSLDHDFLGPGRDQVRLGREFARRRRVMAPAAGGEGSHRMNRLYVAESMPSLTGAAADHRYRVRSSDIPEVALAVAAALGLPGIAPGQPAGIATPEIAAIAADLSRARGRALVTVGPGQPPQVHALAHAMNERLEAPGLTVLHHAPLDGGAEQAAPLSELTADMSAGKVQLLVILGGNPVFTTPAELRFGELLSKVGLAIHLGAYDDETAARCHWHVPEAHDLESWSDARATDGSVVILQPLIEPLYGGKTAHELMAAFGERPLRGSAEIVKEAWARRMPGPGFETRWRRALHDGFVEGTAVPARTTAVRPLGGEAQDNPPRARAGDLELVFRADPSVYDGRFANNGWLQELPRPITKLTWDNAALLSPATARRLGVASEDLVQLDAGGQRVRAPVWIVPGHADDSLTVHLGYGRERTGRVGRWAGFNAYKLRTSASRWIVPGIRVAKTGQKAVLASTQDHGSMEGRPLARHAEVSHYLEHPDFAREMEEAPPRDMTLYPNVKYEGHAWGMAIDLGACIGCNACTVACQAENNIPVVGKEQVKVNREMHWIRVDRYFEGSPEDPTFVHQPVPCMHCENAPCEEVCPVAATVHSSEGLNEMVYNRCVGTRYCANNCPYKVRRFNFLQFADFSTPEARLLHNPNVSVRSRGVMEKCTYCVQRINTVRNVAEVEGRDIRDGEIRTACQQACPAEAITFGDLNDPASRVSRMKAEPRNYALLGGLNVRPRTTYLARLENPRERAGTKEAG